MDFYFDETVVIVHCALSGLLYFAYKECQKILSNFENLPTYEAGRQLSSALNDLGQETIPYAAIRGQVQAVNQPIKTSSGIPAVIQLLISVDHFRHKFFSGSWGSSESLASSTSVFIPFGIRDPANSSRSSLVLIDEPDTADRIKHILVTVGTLFEKPNSNPPVSSSFVSSIAGKFQIGTEKTEKILPIGVLLTAVGKVTRFSDGSTHISNPHDPTGSLPFILTTLTIDEIRTTYQSQLRTYKIGALILACIGGFFALKVMHKWTSCLYIKRLRQNIVKNRNPNGIEGLHDSQICIVCLSNPREVLFIPCGHICLCVDCLQNLQESRCPICRDCILYSYPAFIP